MDPQQAALEGWLRFNDEDVAFNRDGRLSPRQRRQLLWSATWRLVLGGAVSVVAALVAALTLDSALAVLVALVGLLYGLYFLWKGFATMVDTTSGAVAYVTAPLKTRIFRGRYVNYFVDVGPITKNIKRSAFDAIRSGDTYHLYYAPGGRTLLSVEPASATEPLPAHAFGADSAHTWDRLRWSWILLTIGVFGGAIGTQHVVAAHPAQPVGVAGVVRDYKEVYTSGRGAHTDRTIFLEGDDTNYTPDAETAYTPEAPDFYSLIGDKVILYVNAGTTDVIALSDGDTVYAGDWYLHPEHETSYLQLNGALSIVIAIAFIGSGVFLLVRDRRRAEEMPGRPAAYAPPTVQPLKQMWIAIGMVAVVVAFIGLVVASVK